MERFFNGLFLPRGFKITWDETEHGDLHILLIDTRWEGGDRGCPLLVRKIDFQQDGHFRKGYAELRTVLNLLRYGDIDDWREYRNRASSLEAYELMGVEEYAIKF